MSTNIIIQGLTLSDFTQLVSDTVRKEFNSFTLPQPKTNTPKYYTTKEVASILGIAQITIHKMKKRGVLTGTYIGRSVRYSEDEVKRLINLKSKGGCDE